MTNKNEQHEELFEIFEEAFDIEFHKNDKPDSVSTLKGVIALFEELKIEDEELKEEAIKLLYRILNKNIEYEEFFLSLKKIIF